MEVLTMSNKVHVKTGDTVVVLSGSNKGKQGKVMAVSPKEGKVIIEAFLEGPEISVNGFVVDGEMRFAMEDASLVMAGKNGETCEYVFFPGCQLGASDPRYVEKAYASLAEEAGLSCGLILSCCGIPARWAGMEELENDIAERLREQLLRKLPKNL